MNVVKQHGRGKVIGVSVLTAGALGLSLAGTTAFKSASHNATGRVGSAPRAAANVLVYPTVSKDLWAATMDPAMTTLVNDANLQDKIYAGLLKQAYNHSTGKFDIVPDLAAGMPKVSNGGSVYTFKIRPDAMFSDGTRVTAQDVVWTITRALSPKEASPVSYYLYSIKGAQAYNTGKAKTLSSVKALGTDTVQITLENPVAYFLYAFTYSSANIVKNGLPAGAKLTTTPKLVVGAGPFMLKGGTWNYKNQISLVPNPHYYNRKNIKLTELDIPFIGTTDAGFSAYRSGQYPIAQVPTAEFQRYKSNPEFHNTPVLGDVWIAMNTSRKPFDNIHFRRAIAYGINRDAIVNGVLHGAVSKLEGWFPKGILGYTANARSQGAPYYDPAIAKRELAQSGVKNASIQIEYSSENPDTGRVFAQVQSDLKALGITMGLRAVPGNTWADDGNNHRPSMIFSDWYDDYPDPEDFLDYLIKTGAAENWGAYSNGQLDMLINQGNVAQDEGTRLAKYTQAQKIILTQAPVVMLYQFAQQAVISSKIHGMELNPSWGNEPQPVGNNWANVTVSS